VGLDAMSNINQIWKTRDPELQIFILNFIF